MAKKHKLQEKFWAGKFGNEYVERNDDAQYFSGNIRLFSKVFEKIRDVNSVIEFGSNIGQNLMAINQIVQGVEMSAIEINKKAISRLKKNIPGVKKIYNTAIQDFKVDYKRDFVFIKGVLIHINPDDLKQVYNLLYRTSKKYIFICEYYNITPVELMYRGHKGYLYKRDFAGELMDQFPDVKLVDYGFIYRRDKNYPPDEMNWFLLQK